MKNGLIVISLLGISATNAEASYRTIYDLLSSCHAPAESTSEHVMKEASCIGYVGGVIDSVQVIFGIFPELKAVCLPPAGVTPDTALRHVKSWVTKSPDNGVQTGRMGLLLALRDAYPCKL